MNGFLQIEKVTIPTTCLEPIYLHLRNAGEQGLEGIGLLFGVASGSHFKVTHSIIPNQSAYKTPTGLLYHVDGNELHGINVWAYKKKLSLFAQIHSHPTEAYHSQTDDEYAIVTTIGGFSIVIPFFASGPINLSLWAVYRLLPDTGWTYLPTQKVQQIIELI